MLQKYEKKEGNAKEKEKKFGIFGGKENNTYFCT